MAELTAARNNALPYPVYGAPWVVGFPMLDADGDLVTAASTPDAEVSKNFDTFTDCTNESVEVATSSGMYYLILTGTEMTADVVMVIAKSASAGMKTTPIALYPRKLATVRSGTSASAGSLTDVIVLDASASAVDDYYNGMLCIATIDSNIEARIISDYVGSTKTASVVPDWNVAPDNNDTFVIKLPEGQFSLQTGDAFARLGAPAGASIAADLVVIDDFVDALETRLGTPTDLGSGATISANLVDIEGQTDDIASKASQASVDDLPTNAELATSQAAADDATLAAIATLQTSVDDLPTNAELATSQAAADDATLAAIAALNDLSATEVADAVWDAVLADHQDAGSTGEALDDAGGAGDPWSTALPGAYAAGEAGFIVGTNLNATVSSRASQTSVDDLPTNAELATSQAAADDATLAAIAALNDISADDVWDEAVDGSVTARQSIRLANSANGAKLSGAGTTTVTIRDLADSKARVTASVDTDGNRTAVSRDLT